MSWKEAQSSGTGAGDIEAEQARWSCPWGPGPAGETGPCLIYPWKVMTAPGRGPHFPLSSFWGDWLYEGGELPCEGAGFGGKEQWGRMKIYRENRD